MQTMKPCEILTSVYFFLLGGLPLKRNSRPVHPLAIPWAPGPASSFSNFRSGSGSDFHSPSPSSGFGFTVSVLLTPESKLELSPESEDSVSSFLSPLFGIISCHFHHVPYLPEGKSGAEIFVALSTKLALH